MNGDGPSSSTPRGTPSHRGKSPSFVTPNPPGPTNNNDSPSTPTPRGTPSRRGKSATTAMTSVSTHTVNKQPNSTFYSCINIPVEGAVPVNPEENEAGQDDSGSVSDSSRAPRKSKTDALNAIKTRSASVGLEDDDAPENVWAERYRNVPPLVPHSPILNLSTVKTASPRPDSLPPKEPRPFGLEDCPTFYPTTDEFKDPMAYIRSISDQANAHGICKVVPPSGWKMPFVTDTANFRFKTRLQRLNSVEASSRAKINFLEQLYVWHQQQGNPRVSVPTINNKPLDLYALRKEVRKLGGFYAVTKKKQWSDLGRLLGYSGIPGLSTQLKNSYTRVILPYEEYEARNAAKASSPKKATNGQDKRFSSVKPEDLPDSPSSTRSSPLSEPPEEVKPNGGTKPSRPRRSTRMGAQNDRRASPIPAPIWDDTKKSSVQQKDKEDQEQNCEICHKKNRGEEMLLCDGCDCGFHMFCLDPPLDSIPKEQWFCYTCLAGTGGDYGFDDGDEHSLASFQARDAEFRRIWFELHPPERSPDIIDVDDPTTSRIGQVMVSENDLEAEFWRLVNTQEETVEVEYGADVHSTTHGSAMPTMETHPLDPYSKDPWNLNNIPIVSESLLRFIKSDISGMTVPWTYVGMTFSTFCWHNEDHYTYSINFMHWGETKTWYGIPGADAEKFEAAIKSEAPDLFQAQPDLLFQLVTLMNPQRVRDAGVRVYACNQRAGEFVVTCPKSYHAGFNHGLNFNEAVNFALPDWLPFGRECVQRYRDHRKLPVFSHDELLITITQQSQSIKTAIWLIDNLQEMTDRELAERQTAREQGMKEVLEEEDRPEDQYQCSVCKVFCYLSQVTCACTSAITCVDHAHLLCERSLDHLVLRKRFSDEDLVDTLNQVSARASIPVAWHQKLSKLLRESPRPLLRSLRALHSEGERINYPLPQLASLRKCVGRANEWVDSANSYLIRKQSRKRARKSRGRPAVNDSAMEDPGDRPDKGLDELHKLLRDVENLGFDSPEIASLRTLGQTAEETKSRAAALLSQANQSEDREQLLEDCRRLIADSSSLNVLIEELVEIEKLVDREQLLQELEDKNEDSSSLPLDEVRQVLVRARACGLSAENEQVIQLEARLKTGTSWEDKARNLLAQPIKTIQELEQFSQLDGDAVTIDKNILAHLRNLLAKAKDFEKQALAWLQLDPTLGLRPKVHEVVRLAVRAEKDFSIPAVEGIRKTADIALDLEAQCDLILKHKYAPGSDEDIFRTIQGWKEYVKNHLRFLTLPSWSKLDEQYTRHLQWTKSLPWYCPAHQEAEVQPIMEDVIEATRVEDQFAPNDEYFTCICDQPVRPPAPGAQSDAVQCDHCYARFHGDCANNGGSCPFCDHHHWNGSIHKERSFHYSFLPAILVSAPDLSRIYSNEFKELQLIVHHVDHLVQSVGQFLSQNSDAKHLQPEYLPQVRHYMRKLYKLQFPVSTTPDVSYGLDLSNLHRALAQRKGPVSERHAQKLAARRKEKEDKLANKKRRLRFVFGQDEDVDWRDGTRCICRGRTPYLINYPMVMCTHCHHKYHAPCVFFPDRPHQPGAPPMKMPTFDCPLCLVRKNLPYPHAEVRIRPPPAMKKPSDVYIDIGKMVENNTRDMIFKTQSAPVDRTLFVELIRVTNSDSGHPKLPPETKEDQRVARSVYKPSNQPYRHPHGDVTAHSASISAPLARPPRQISSRMTRPSSPPPPPWSSSSLSARTGTAQVPITIPDSPSPSSASAAKKRKLDELHSFQEPVTIYPKRRVVADPEPPRNVSTSYRPVTPPPHSTASVEISQKLSPSLAKIVISGSAPPPRAHPIPDPPRIRG
ncbi:Jumonji superfamily protein [Mycena indigotica]|uniref:[histone H3]-trimethyl-L-lysine(4) demethylase n=1 Tax=Mycena indigotica TaxID=2126181 RepID=A0A8H6SPL8_9AGAR|nr:Jumonji superfamily protein [Mycena indigotica]KAF7302052.1 Jumonji superfamily protein [Mycena indigotica]